MAEFFGIFCDLWAGKRGGKGGLGGFLLGDFDFEGFEFFFQRSQDFGFGFTGLGFLAALVFAVYAGGGFPFRLVLFHLCIRGGGGGLAGRGGAGGFLLGLFVEVVGDVAVEEARLFTGAEFEGFGYEGV